MVLALPLKKRGGWFFDKQFLLDFGKLLLCSALMGAAAYFARSLLEGRAGKLLTLCIPAAAGVTIYALLTWALGLEEAKLAAGAVRKLLNKEAGK